MMKMQFEVTCENSKVNTGFQRMLAHVDFEGEGVKPMKEVVNSADVK